MRDIFVMLIFIMIATVCPAQNNNPIANGKVEFISYTAFGYDQTGGIKRMDIVQRKNNTGYVARIEQSDKIEYIYFNLKNMQTNNGDLAAGIDPSVAYNVYSDAWIDNDAYGIFTFNVKTGVNTLDLHCKDYHEHDRQFILKWKALPNFNENASLHEYMRNRTIISSEEKHLPIKKWEDEKIEGLMDQIAYYPIGGWGFDGENNDGKYSYSLYFEPTGEISFIYFENGLQSGELISDIALERRGTFDIYGDTMEIHFTKLLGNRYDRPNIWDDPLEDNLIIKIKIEIQTNSYNNSELIIKQIAGTNIFENHPENTPLLFLPYILPPVPLELIPSIDE